VYCGGAVGGDVSVSCPLSLRAERKEEGARGMRGMGGGLAL